MQQKTRAETVLKNKKMYRSILVMLALTAAGTARLSHADTISVCYDHWAPMTIFPSAESSERGVVIDMLEQIYTAQGYQLEYYEVPLARGLDMVAQGLCDMLPEYLYTRNSEKGFVYAAEETFTYPSAFVVRRDDPWRYDGVQSIQGRRVATGPGWDYSSMSAGYQDFISDPQNSDFVEVIAGYDDVVDRILRMIRDNRVDIYADNELVLQYALNRLNLENELIVVHPGLETKLVEMPIFSTAMPAARRQTLMRIWNEGRLSLKGERERLLLEKYNLTFHE